MKKVLIVTYHWPPMGGGGVQRWLKTVKYLREFDWEPVIFTVTDAEISLPDHSLEEEIPEGVETLRVPIWEPFGLYKKITGKSSSEKVQPGLLSEGEGSNWRNELALWIRGNVFIPDAKRFWIKPARKALIKYLKQNRVDAMVSTGPPHTTHMIALAARKRTGTPWLADFRDPWTFVDYYDKLKLSRYADRRHHQLEAEVVNTADKTITVTWSWAADFNRRNYEKEVEVITNGFDPADFPETPWPALSQKFVITHIGSMNADRNPKALWPILDRLSQEWPEFAQQLQIKLIGPVDGTILAAIRKSGLEDNLEHIKNLPHKEVIPHLQSSPLLLLPLNDTPNIAGVVPGKLFEYLAARRPILCIGKTDGDAAHILRETGVGKVWHFSDEAGIEQSLREYWRDFQAGRLAAPEGAFQNYSRRKLAGDIAQALNAISR